MFKQVPLLQPLSRAAANIVTYGSSTRLKVTLSKLLDDVKDLDFYYTYKGSLTTPGCFESVTWILFGHPVKVNTNQVMVQVH